MTHPKFPPTCQSCPHYKSGTETLRGGAVKRFEVCENAKPCEHVFEPVGELSFSMSIKYRNMHRMSRKRFVKLVMAKGIQRNEANSIARFVHAIGQPYKQAGDPVNLFLLLNQRVVVSACS